MDTRKVDIIATGSGIAIGWAAGAAISLTRGTPVIASWIIGIIVGLVVSRYILKVVLSDEIQNADVSTQLKLLLAAGSLALAVIAGCIVAISYKNTTPGANKSRDIIMGMLVGIPLGLLTWKSGSKHFVHRAKSRNKRVQIDETANFLGRRLTHFLYLLSDFETKVVYSERPPLMQGILMIGMPFELALFSIWGRIRFAGYHSVFEAAQDRNWSVIGIVGILLAMAVIWFAKSLEEVPLTHPLEVLTDEEQKKKRRQQKWIIVGSVIGLVSACILLRFPYWRWLRDEATTVPSHLWTILTVPLVIWTILRWSDYLTSGIILTNVAFRKGSRGLILPSAALSVMSRSKMNTHDLEQGVIPGLLGYYKIVVTDNSGKLEKVFQVTRATHGDVLDRLLPDDDNNSSPFTPPPVS
jgi:putative flippase GtrA